MHDIEQTGPPALRSFVTGLRTDPDAVTAGLTLDYSPGPVEGTVNRITCAPSVLDHCVTRARHVRRWNARASPAGC